MEKEMDRCVISRNMTLNAEPGTSSYDIEDDPCVNDDEPEVVIRTGITYFKDYVATKGHSLHSISQMPPIQIAEYLKDFYTTVKSQDLEPFPSSLKYIRTGLQKYFQKNLGIDIVKDRDFEHANNIFEVTVKQIPRRCHRLRIEFDDLKKLYMGPALNLDQPDTLQNKVFFDVNLYICNRGKDFLRVMSKTDFEVATDIEGRRYIWLKYNSKFSFKELIGGLSENDSVIHGNQIGERMYERPGDPKCPVASFLQYLTHLHPMTEAFWQRPKRNFVASDYVWYDNTPLGNSTISKIMTRTCQMAGLFENYTNHAIKSSYIPVIENICLEALRKAPMEGCNSPQQRRQVSRTDSGIGEGSICSEIRDSTADDLVDEQKDGLRQAKMKVLDVVHGLEVKDIRTFVDWLKTFKVEYDGGGLMVMCSPVDQNSEVKKEQETKHPGILNGEKLREYSPSPSMPHKTGSPSSMLTRLPSSMDREIPKVATPERNFETKAADFGVAVRQLEFESVCDTYCSTTDISPIKVTVPSENSVLVTGLRDNVQLLIHSKESFTVAPEPLHSRIFFSQNDMDVAVTAVLSAKNNNLKGNSVSNMENTDTSTRLQDKHKPVKKRSLTDLNTGISREEYEMPPKKQYIGSFPTFKSDYQPKFQNTAENKPTSIYNVPLVNQAQERLPMSRIPPFSGVHRSFSSPLISVATSTASIKNNNDGLRIKSEPVE